MTVIGRYIPIFAKKNICHIVFTGSVLVVMISFIDILYIDVTSCTVLVEFHVHFC